MKTHTHYLLRISITILAIYLPCFASGAAEENTIALVGERIIDGVNNRAVEGKAVLVKGEYILGLVDEAEIPAGTTRIDLPGTTLMPGFIDSHAHPLMPGDDYQQVHLQKSSAYKALKGYIGMQNLMKAGWTTLRVAGDADVFYANQDIKRLVEEGVLQAPRLFGAAHYLSITGGGGDVNYYSPEQKLVADGLVVDGVDEIRRAIRTEAKYGADWVKVLVTGAFMSVGDDPKNVAFSEEELKALMEEAQRQGMPVMAHAHAAEGIKMAVKMGARSIEHGTYLDDEAIRLMKKHGTYLVPTVYVGDYYNDPRNNLREQAVSDEYTRNYRHIFLQNIGKAHKAGVKVAVGVDLGGYDYDPTVYVREIAVLMEAGLSAMAAIKAATSVPGEMLGKNANIGSLEKGRFADVIAVPGNPLIDISTLEKVSFVMFNGQVVKQEH